MWFMSLSRELNQKNMESISFLPSLCSSNYLILSLQYLQQEIASSHLSRLHLVTLGRQKRYLDFYNIL